MVGSTRKKGREFMPLIEKCKENEYTHYVYLITNLINGKKYIGKRSCKCKIEDDIYMGSGKALKRAFLKYGMENFTKEILEICETEGGAYQREEYYIRLYNAYNSQEYYNLNMGGVGVMSGIKHSEETRKKMSRSKMGKKLTEEAKEKVRKAKMGNNPSEETREKMSRAKIGKKLTEETRRKVSEASGKKRKCICVNTGKIYGSVVEAAKDTNSSSNHVSGCCRGTRSATRSKNTNQFLQWAYINEDGSYKIPDEHIPKEIKLGKKVMCLNTMEIFDSVSDAGREMGCEASNISKCCKGKAKSAGKHPVTKEHLRWKFYTEDIESMIEP